MSDCELEQEGVLDTCGVCGDTYNIQVELERGNKGNLCNYHYDHRFGGYDTDDSDGVIEKPEVFAAQDWRQEEVNELLLMLEPSKFPGIINVVEDEWIKEDGIWFLAFKGRTGVECLTDLLAAPVLNYDIKKLICHFLTRNKVIKKTHSPCYSCESLKLTGCMYCFFKVELRKEQSKRVVFRIIEDQRRGVHGPFSDFYYGRESYCVRCGDYKHHQRYNLILHGVCLDCGYAGLMNDHRNEGFNNFVDYDDRNAANYYHLVCPRATRSFFILVDGLKVHRQPFKKGFGALQDFAIEWPELEHPEWIISK